MDRVRLSVFLASGALWTIGASVGLAPGLVLAAVAVAYVVIGGLSLSMAGERTRRTASVLWGGAVLLVTAVFLPVAGVLAVVVGLLYGTLCFGVWFATGYLLLHFVTRHRTTVRS